MYSIADYGTLIADKVRMDAFVRALRQAVKPGSVVVDIGTGTGIFALLACRFGARRVYAIEPNDAIEVAREIAAANGYAERIEFHQAMSTQVTLPERADVIVADIGGVLPWFQRHIGSIADARRRFLAPGGVIIPERDTVWTAVVEADDVYARHTGPWTNNEFGLDMNAARRIVINTWAPVKAARNQLLAEPRRWTTVEYNLVEEPDVRATVDWTITRAGTGHGLVAGFDRTVAEGVYLSNAPDRPDAIRPDWVYSTVFFPWPTPVALSAGDVVAADLEARLIHDDYIWSWKTRVLDQGRPGAEKANFAQSTFFGTPLSPAQLKKQAADYIPSLNGDARITLFVLTSMSDRVPLGEIAESVRSMFPGRFDRFEDALTYVADISSQYG